MMTICTAQQLILQYTLLLLINFPFALKILSKINTFIEYNNEHTAAYIKYILHMQHTDC